MTKLPQLHKRAFTVIKDGCLWHQVVYTLWFCGRALGWPRYIEVETPLFLKKHLRCCKNTLACPQAGQVPRGQQGRALGRSGTVGSKARAVVYQIPDELHSP